MGQATVYKRILAFQGGVFFPQDTANVGEPVIGDVFERELVAEFDDQTGIAISVARHSGYVPVVIELVPCRPQLSFDSWDHVVECNLYLPSGEVELFTRSGSTDYAWETRAPQPGAIAVCPGMYRALVLFGNRHTAVTQIRLGGVEFIEGPEMPSNDHLLSLDHYRVILWPVAVQRLKVLKQFELSRQPSA